MSGNYLKQWKDRSYSYSSIVKKIEMLKTKRKAINISVGQSGKNMQGEQYIMKQICNLARKLFRKSLEYACTCGYYIDMDFYCSLYEKVIAEQFFAAYQYILIRFEE